LHTNKIPLYPPLIKGEVKGDLKKIRRNVEALQKIPLCPPFVKGEKLKKRDLKKDEIPLYPPL